MKSYFPLKLLVLIYSFNLSLPAIATTVNIEQNSTKVTFQVNTSKQIQQDEIMSSLRIEKVDLKSEEVQSQINASMKMALDLSKKYPDVKTSTGRYFVYKDEQKSLWKANQTILINSFAQTSAAQLVGELQKNGFLVDNYSYTLSEKSQRSMDDVMRIELLQKASQIAINTIAKGLNKKFIRFIQVDFNSQNFYPVLSMRTFSSANSMPNSDNNPIAQAALSTVQMNANITAIFGE